MPRGRRRLYNGISHSPEPSLDHHTLTLTDTLRACELFSHFSDGQIAGLADCTARNHYPEGVKVVRHGDPTKDAYIVESGSVFIQRDTPYGVFQLARLGAGELFGEATFVDSSERSGDAVAATDLDLLTLNPLAVRALTDRDPRLNLALYWAFWKSLSAKLRSTNERLTRFFSETGGSPALGDAPKAEPAEDFRVEMTDKRKVFEEQKLSGLEINFLTSLSKERRLAPNETIFRDGDPGEEMFIVLEGRVMISKFIPGAGEEALAFLERGEIFGEMALIDGQARCADAKAASAGAVILAIRAETLHKLLDIRKASSIRILKLLCRKLAQRLRDGNEKLIGWYLLSAGSHAEGLEEL